MAGKPWTQAEDDALEAEYRDKYLTPERAKETHPERTMVALQNRLSSRRIPFKLRAGRDSARYSEPAQSEPVGDETRLEREQTGDSEYMHCRSTSIRTLEDLLAYAEVDTSIWEVERVLLNKYEMGAKDDQGQIQTRAMHQIKAWLKRNKVAVNMKAVRDEVIAEMNAHAPRNWIIPAGPAGDGAAHMLELSIPDLHMGKLAWGEETGADYDLKIARDLFHWALDELIRKASGFRIGKVLLPYGNDMMQVDNPRNTTTAGTQVDVDSRYGKVYRTTWKLQVEGVERVRGIGDETEVVYIGGNHDRDSMFTQGEVVTAWYRNDPTVTVNNAPRLRKYVTFGRNLLGFTHGSEEKPASLPLIMATEQPDAWAAATFREWHCGHLHVKRETKFLPVDEFNGVRVRIIPSLCATDAWHASQGYVQGRRSAESYIWHPEDGPVGQFSANVHPERIAA